MKRSTSPEAKVRQVRRSDIAATSDQRAATEMTNTIARKAAVNLTHMMQGAIVKAVCH
jgi:hypothetical protein